MEKVPRFLPPNQIPPNAFLMRYRQSNAYTDCLNLEVKGEIDLKPYIEAFYTSPLFKLERFVIAALVGKPSTDAQARLMARAETDSFSAWTVEARAGDQILLCDYLSWSRSWLMCAPSGEDATRLYFGTAIVTARKSGTLQALFNSGFSAFNVVHRLYAKALLKAAAARLSKLPSD